MKTFSLTLAALSLALVSSSALAQSRFTQVYTAANNFLTTASGSVLTIQQSDAGAFVSTSVEASFTGLDRMNEERTTTFAGQATAQANFGRLRTRTSGTVANTYYNEANAPYYLGEGNVDPAGSPDSFTSAAFAGFTDVLSFGGGAMAGYSSRYVFFVDGEATPFPIASFLSATITGGEEESFRILEGGGRVAQYYATDLHPISALTGQTADILFTTQFNPALYIVEDGSDLSGFGEFSSTITLAAIEVFDANGNQVMDATATGASGTVYPTVRPVPEPASMAALGLGVLALLKRRRR